MPAITQEIIQLISLIGVGNFLIVGFALFVFFNLPTIIDKILARKKERNASHQASSDMTFIRTQISNIWDEKKETDQKIDDIISALVSYKSESDTIIKTVLDQNQQRYDEHNTISNNMEMVVASIDSIEKMMRNVMSEKDAMAVVALKMGSVEDFKTKLIMKLKDAISSDLKNGQLKANVNAIINSAWLDLKSELTSFNFPFNTATFLDSLDKELWERDGMLAVIQQIAISDLPRKDDAIRNQMDRGLRDIQAKLSKYISETNIRRRP